MRKILLFFVFILSVLLSSNTTFAKETNPQTSSDTQSPEMSEEKQATPSSFIEYNLAYPGILPDHPLYKLKVLRDKISAVLISDPLKKIDFYLLQTDKGILAAAMLVDKKNIELSMETALKAEHNFTLITQQMERIDKLDNEASEHLHTAALKHQEVLLSLAKRVPKKQAETFLTVADFSKRNWQTIEEYKDEMEEKRLDSTSEDD